LFWLFGVWAAVKPADALSTSERRPLAQMPELSASSYLSGKFMSGYEDYATDQFPLREQFRTLKALMGLYVFGQKDNNGVYLADGFAAKLEYPLNEGSVAHAADRFRYLYETLMAGTDAKVYLSVIPDKNLFFGGGQRLSRSGLSGPDGRSPEADGVRRVSRPVRHADRR